MPFLILLFFGSVNSAIRSIPLALAAIASGGAPVEKLGGDRVGAPVVDVDGVGAVGEHERRGADAEAAAERFIAASSESRP